MKIRVASSAFLIFLLLAEIAIFVFYVVETDYWPFAFHKDLWNYTITGHAVEDTTTAASVAPLVFKSAENNNNPHVKTESKKTGRSLLGRIAMLTNPTTGEFIPDIVNFPDFRQLASNGPYYCLLPIMLFIIIGIALLFGNIRCSTFTGSALVLFLASFTFLWAGLVIPWILQSLYNDPSDHEKIFYNVTLLMEVFYGVLAMVIAYGAVIGVATSFHALVMVFFGVVAYGTVRGLILAYFLVPDFGGTISVFFFGGIYGTFVALFMYRYEDSENGIELSYCNLYNSYVPNIISFIGTLIIISVFPYFCVFYIPTTFNMFSRSIVNSVFATLAGVVSAFFFSGFVTSKQKFDLLHIQRATLAGGIAVASVAPLYLEIWGAILLGFAAGMFTVIAFKIHEYFVKNVFLVDTGAVFATFVAPGFVGSLAVIIMSSLIDNRPYEPYELLLLYPATVTDFGIDAFASVSTQATYAFLSLVTALCIALIAAILVALINRWLWPYKPCQTMSDNKLFAMPFSELFECDHKDVSKCEQPQKIR